VIRGGDAQRRGGPDFIVVGPEKTGTTWLHTRLNEHPDVWLPPSKEIGFFNEHLAHPGRRWRQRFADRDGYYGRRYWKYLSRRPGHLFRYPHHVFEPWRLVWSWRYLFDVHDDDWYLWAFRAAGERRLAGDISPPYFFMPEAGVAHVRRLAPDAKIVLFIRDPVEWRWSFVRMIVAKTSGRRLSEMETSEIDRILDRWKGYSFAESVALWRRHFPAEQVFVCFFDQLDDEPETLFHDICAFIGAEPARMPAAALQTLGEKVNVGLGAAPPEQVRARLIRDSRDDIAKLAAAFPDYPRRWAAAHGLDEAPVAPPA
jgi:hypothetical protein